MYRKLVYILCLLSLQGCNETKNANVRGFTVTPMSHSTQNNQEDLLNVLKTQSDTHLKPIHISLREGDKVYQKGERLNFSIDPIDKKFNALTLFNLAGNGDLQFLYPVGKDPLQIEKFPYTLTMKIDPPFGQDNLVVLLCTQAATELHRLLIKSQPNIPEPEQILNQLHQNHCQMGQYPFYSEQVTLYHNP